MMLCLVDMSSSYLIIVPLVSFVFFFPFYYIFLFDFSLVSPLLFLFTIPTRHLTHVMLKHWVWSFYMMGSREKQRSLSGLRWFWDRYPMLMTTMNRRLVSGQGRNICVS